MKKRSVYKVLLCTLCFISLFCMSCDRKTSSEDSYSIAVFIPGMLAGSPTYEMMNQGVLDAAEENNNVIVKTIEGGFNQAEWQEKITALAAEKNYDLIVTSNPAMPQICENTARVYTDQKFICLEGYSENPNISSFLFNHTELSFILGYLGGLITMSEMPNANDDLKVGLISGEEYPVMNRIIKPGFALGLNAVNPDIELDFRTVGNWYDATHAADLAQDMINNGVDVILAIAGSANQGIISAAREFNAYCLWYDTDGYNLSPGVIIGSGQIIENKAAFELTTKAINGELEYGTPLHGGIEDGYIDFISDNSNFSRYVLPETRIRLQAIITRMKQGEIPLDMPIF